MSQFLAPNWRDIATVSAGEQTESFPSQAGEMTAP